MYGRTDRQIDEQQQQQLGGKLFLPHEGTWVHLEPLKTGNVAPRCMADSRREMGYLRCLPKFETAAVFATKIPLSALVLLETKHGWMPKRPALKPGPRESNLKLTRVQNDKSLRTDERRWECAGVRGETRASMSTSMDSKGNFVQFELFGSALKAQRQREFGLLPTPVNGLISVGTGNNAHSFKHFAPDYGYNTTLRRPFVTVL